MLMAHRAPKGGMNIGGFGIILLGVVLIAAPLFVPLSVVGWLGGDSFLTVQVFTQIDADDQWDYKAEGALCYVQKTEPDQMDPVDVWGGSSPTATDEHGTMTFYTSLGVHYWKVVYNGHSIDGYAIANTEGEGVRIWLYMEEGFAEYRTPSTEYIPEEDEPEPDPEPSPPTVEDPLLIFIDSEPVVGRVTIIDMTDGSTLADGDCPLQATYEGQVAIRVMFHAVDGYVKPSTIETVITEDAMIMGTYIESTAEPGEPPVEDPDVPEPEPLEIEEVELTEDEEAYYETTTVDETDTSAEKALEWDARVDMLKGGKSPVALFMQLGGVLFIFIGFTQVAAPTLTGKRQ